MVFAALYRKYKGKSGCETEWSQMEVDIGVSSDKPNDHRIDFDALLLSIHVDF